MLNTILKYKKDLSRTSADEYPYDQFAGGYISYTVGAGGIGSPGNNGLTGADGGQSEVIYFDPDTYTVYTITANGGIGGENNINYTVQSLGGTANVDTGGGVGGAVGVTWVGNNSSTPRTASSGGGGGGSILWRSDEDGSFATDGSNQGAGGTGGGCNLAYYAAETFFFGLEDAVYNGYSYNATSELVQYTPGYFSFKPGLAGGSSSSIPASSAAPGDIGNGGGGGFYTGGIGGNGGYGAGGGGGAENSGIKAGGNGGDGLIILQLLDRNYQQKQTIIFDENSPGYNSSADFYLPAGVYGIKVWVIGGGGGGGSANSSISGNDGAPGGGGGGCAYCEWL